MQRRSFGSVQVAFLNRENAIRELIDRARALVVHDPRVMAVGLFGSLARGQALPSSDADLLIVLHVHSNPRWFDRISDYDSAFENTGLPVEVFPYTWQELSRRVSQPGMLRTALRESIPLAGDATCFARLAHLVR